MPKNTNAQTAQPSPQMDEGEAIGVAEVSQLPLSATKTRKGLDMFLASTATISENVASKLQTTSEIRQRLAEAHDLELQGGEAASEATTIADQQAKRLYALRTEGAVTAEEASGLLGDVFGYKEKKDGTPSKTPLGLGKMVRDRVVRLYNAHEHINGRDGGSFFDGLPVDEVKTVVTQVENGHLTVWDAQKELSELRSSVNVRPAFAFDPKRIIGLAAELSEEGAASKVIANVNLQRAYGELIKSLAIIGMSSDGEEEGVE